MRALIIGLILIASPVLAAVRCTALKAADTLILDGQRQHAERFVECVTGRWPDVRSKFRKVMKP